MTADRAIVDGTVPYGYKELCRDLAELRRTYPFLHIESIGRSVMGKELYAVRIGRAKRSVFLNGAFHANEWITAPIVLKFMEQCARAWKEGGRIEGVDAAKLFSSVELWVVPMVNPDGVELALRGAGPEHPYARQLKAWNGGSDDFSGWKANVRGVDLNDQFPAFWEVERDRRDVPGPGPRDYTGEAPLTEPEAAAIAAFTEARDFDAVAALHTQGEEIYWNYRDREPPEAEGLARAMEAVSGYKAVKLTGSDAGYKDWFIHRFGRPGFTVEAGLGINPLPTSQFPAMYDASSSLFACLLLALNGAN
ncbi:M14 family metallocarboxypeptidase [Paenibacillus sp. TRM 82003]|nr:M14 family metallocarboxypeptidase [Paenibacillus sp. TRM 82003]